MNKISSLITVLFFTICVKILLIPAYKSTDFDVHQNWLRITYNEDITKWYFDKDLSKWTLDYPPLFAYFQYMLSYLAIFIDSSIVAIQGKTFTQQTIIFQRVSVILSEFIYIFVIWNYLGPCKKLIIGCTFIPFLMLDNIHFQYNTMMQGIFLASIFAIQDEKYLKGAFLFSVLLNFKHIYIYSAPVFFVFILKWYVLKDRKNIVINFFKVALTTLTPFILSFGLFLYFGGLSQLSQILNRMFPFQRGLVHEYWAPNFWAIYMTADKILSKLFSFIYPTPLALPNSLKILPNISPIITILIILVLIIPLLFAIFKGSERQQFSHLVSVCGISFFMFGYHAHEKAISPYINVLLISGIGIDTNLAILVNIINLVPLILGPSQRMLNIILVTIWVQYYYSQSYQQKKTKIDIFFKISGLIIMVFHLLIHPLINNQKLQFLPLLLNSLWAASFNCYWLFCLYYKVISDNVQNSQPRSQVKYLKVNQ